MSARQVLLAALFVNISILLLYASSLSITYHGAKIIYEDSSATSYILRGFLALFGNNDMSVRAPLILMNTLSAIVLYLLSKEYAKSDRERVWLVVIFLLLPGVISSSLLVDGAALVTLTLLVYIYLYKIVGQKADLLLPFMLFAESGFLFLFAGMFIFVLSQKRYLYSLFYLLLVICSLYLYSFNTGGIPINQFLDTLGLYGALFSPIVFLYLVYTLYRRLVLGQVDMILIISSTAFVLSLVLSFRQRVEIEMFAPYLILALPLAMETFYRSYRIRLREFRGRYRMLFVVAISLLLANAAVVFLNKWAYRFVENPSSYFAYRTHVASELADELKRMSITCIDANDEKMQLRLRFYEIQECERYSLGDSGKRVTISYLKTSVADFYVSDLHSK